MNVLYLSSTSTCRTPPQLTPAKTMNKTTVTTGVHQNTRYITGNPFFGVKNEF